MPKPIYYTTDATQIVETNDGFRILATEEFFTLNGTINYAEPIEKSEYCSGEVFFTLESTKKSVDLHVPCFGTLLAICMEDPEDIKPGTCFGTFLGKLDATGLMSEKQFREWIKEQK